MPTTVVLVEHPRNFASYRALELAALTGLRFVLLTSAPKKYWTAIRNPRNWLSDIVQTDTSQTAAVLASIKSERLSPAAIISFSHHFCEVAARAAVASGLWAPNPDAIGTAVNKGRMRQRLKGSPHTVPYAIADDVASVTRAVADLGLPVVVKPLNDVSSTDVTLAPSMKDAIAAAERVMTRRLNAQGLPRDQRVLLEEYALGPEFSVEGFTTEGTTRILGVTSKSALAARPFIEQADSYPLSDDSGAGDEIKSAARSAIERLGGFAGPSHVEVRMTEGGPRIIEVNPRQGGGHIPTLIEIVTGTNVFLDTLSAALGLELTRFEPSASAATWWQCYPASTGILGHLPSLSVSSDEPYPWLEWLRTAGDSVRVPVDNRDCIGGLITTGASISESLERARRLSSQLEPEVLATY